MPDDSSRVWSADDRQTGEGNDQMSEQGKEATTPIIPTVEGSFCDVNERRNSWDNCFVFRCAERSFLARCPCQSHLATQLIDRSYSLSVERLFDCVFGDNDFLTAYRASRRVKGSLSLIQPNGSLTAFVVFHEDFHATEWQVNERTRQRQRMCTYKVGVAAVFGGTTICSNETQVSRRIDSCVCECSPRPFNE